MYLKYLTISNFRKYKLLEVEFKNGLNVLIGENDQGKTAIIDAIRYLLNTKSFEATRFDSKDFHQSQEGERADTFEITAKFSDFEDKEAAQFLEWGYFASGTQNFELRVQLRARLQSGNRITWDLKAGPAGAETQMDGNARELLQVTYLKPLRDAEVELTPGYRSRLAQILQSHNYFKINNKAKSENHELVNIVLDANNKIKAELQNVKANSQKSSPDILTQINTYLKQFQHVGDGREAAINIADPDLHKILRSLGLEIERNSSGLGTLNKLFMAAELLHLETDPYNALRLCLIEEIEAHLHPQAQLRVIKALEAVKSTQFIITTHSTTLGASIKLDNLILCRDNDVYPMWQGKTELSSGDYSFLQRFLDATKANLFFARGVIMVEGDAENILIPVIADLIGLPLHKHGVSIVNVGSTAFSRYAKIFNRREGKPLEIPVAVVTDLDVRAIEYYTDASECPEYYEIADAQLNAGDNIYDLSSIEGNIYFNKDQFRDAIKKALGQLRMPTGVNDAIDQWKKSKIDKGNIADIRLARKSILESSYSNPVKSFVNDYWTLEYDIALSSDLRIYMAKAVLIANKINSSEAFWESLYNENSKFEVNNDNPDKNFTVNADADTLCSGDNDFDIAYRIFKDFLGKTPPSKAVTAQILSEILKNVPSIKEILLKDSKVAYLIKAIKYACRQEYTGAASDAAH